MDNAVIKVNDLGLNSELDKMFSRVRNLVEKYSSAKDENKLLKEKVKELEHSLNDIRIELSGRSSDVVNKEREINELKSRLLDERKNKLSVEEKSQLKSRIKELMVRLDTHLETKTGNNF